MDGAHGSRLEPAALSERRRATRCRAAESECSCLHCGRRVARMAAGAIDRAFAIGAESVRSATYRMGVASEPRRDRARILPQGVVDALIEPTMRIGHGTLRERQTMPWARFVVLLLVTSLVATSAL